MVNKEEVEKAYDAAYAAYAAYYYAAKAAELNAKAAAWDDTKAAADFADEAWNKYAKLKREYDNGN